MTEPHVPAILQMRRRVEKLAELRLSPSARLLAWAILLHANARGECWPGTATLRELTGLDARTIKRVRPALAAAFDYIAGGSERGATRRPSRYRFLLDHRQETTHPELRRMAMAARDRGLYATSTGGLQPPVPGAECPPKSNEGQFKEPMSEGNAATARMNVARIIREMAEVTEPPGLQRAVL